MSILTALTAIFPLELRAIDSQETWNNTTIKLKSGARQTNINWSDSLRIFDASTAEHLTIAQLNSVRKHFNSMRGSAYSFPLRDRSFFQATDEGLGVAGAAASTMQLSINDGVAANAYNKEIYLPENGTIVIKANAVTQTETTHYTINYTTGVLTWVADRTGQTITWTGNFYLPVRYSIDTFPNMELFIWQSAGVGLVKGAPIPLEEVRWAAEV